MFFEIAEVSDMECPQLGKGLDAEVALSPLESFVSRNGPRTYFGNCFQDHKAAQMGVEDYSFPIFSPPERSFVRRIQNFQ